ncbi:MAG: hypothetical protein ACLQSR_02270, partial [Limisphaerales bacterium]
PALQLENHGKSSVAPGGKMPPSTADRMSAATTPAQFDFSDTLLKKYYEKNLEYPVFPSQTDLRSSSEVAEHDIKVLLGLWQ